MHPRNGGTPRLNTRGGRAPPPHAPRARPIHLDTSWHEALEARLVALKSAQDKQGAAASVTKPLPPTAAELDALKDHAFHVLLQQELAYRNGSCRLPLFVCLFF